MGMSSHPSSVTLPPAEKPYPALLEFFIQRFPDIQASRWRARILAGKVLDQQGVAVTLDSAYTPHQRLYYFREVDEEPCIPFAEEILFQNDEIVVACKPHFLPVIPGGRYVNECLLSRLQRRTGNMLLTPVHRIDRETAGLVLFSANKKTRSLYHALFARGEVEKTYHALADFTQRPLASEWWVENRITRGEPWYTRKVIPGPVNARSHIRLVEACAERGRFILTPVTGKTHQLRIHMSGMGFTIVNDRYYPVLHPRAADDREHPLRLIAKSLRFRDPVSGVAMEFVSERELTL
jgi:tRNA pseudouridine32 synthase / 23S rRNA pseudouridine746 synthase